MLYAANLASIKELPGFYLPESNAHTSICIKTNNFHCALNFDEGAAKRIIVWFLGKNFKWFARQKKSRTQDIANTKHLNIFSWDRFSWILIHKLFSSVTLHHKIKRWLGVKKMSTTLERHICVWNGAILSAMTFKANANINAVHNWYLNIVNTHQTLLKLEINYLEIAAIQRVFF